MDFDAAIRSHAEWKMRLTRYLKSPDHSLESSFVERDDQCALGKWLYGEGNTLAGQPRYQELLRTHAEFHRAAGTILRRIDAGETLSADVLFGPESEYSRLSGEVVILIMHMRRKAA